MAKKGGLGRGLSSLIPNKPQSAQATRTKPTTADQDRIWLIPVKNIKPNPHQPRTEFGHKDMEDLVNSIKEHGIIQPLVVTKLHDDIYELIAGERRLRAAEIAKLKDVPAVVRDAKEQQKLEVALVENIQRKNLNAIELAAAYKKLQDQFSLKLDKIAKKVGKSVSAVSNILRLLKLPEIIQRAIQDGKITEGHARAIVSLDNENDQLRLFEKIIKENYNVRETESAARKVSASSSTKRMRRAFDPALENIKDDLRGYLGTKVNISKRGGRGKIEIEFYSDEEFKDIIKKITK